MRPRWPIAGLELLLAVVLAACASSGTPAPGSSESAAPASSPTGGSPTATPPGVSAKPSGDASAASPSSEPSASAQPSATLAVASLPPPGAAHTYSCTSLISAARVSAIVGIQSVLFVLPSGVKAPKPPKGETQCPFLGAKVVKKSYVVMTTRIYIYTGAARKSAFDPAWLASRSSPLVVTVPGVGDDAAWLAPLLTLYGIKGAVAFQVQVEPSPLTLATPDEVRSMVTAIAKVVAGHL